MPFLQMKKIKNCIQLLTVFLTVLLLTGCVSQNTEKAGPVEKKSPAETKIAEIDSDIRQIHLVSASMQNSEIQIQVQGNQKLVYTSIKQAFPFGIAVYLPETRIAEDFKSIVPDHDGISDVVVKYADKDESSVKVEILLSQDFDYEVIEGDTDLEIALSGSMDSKPVEIAKTNETAPPEKEKIIEKIIAEESVVIPDETATIKHIEFTTTEDGKSDIVIQTNHPVKYDISPKNNNKLYLDLYNTKIPYYHKRPIITEYFKSAVARLMPIELPGTQKTARIEIDVREQVPYRVVRGENEILLYFEPSTLEPPEFTKAKKKVVSGVQTESAKAVVIGENQLSAQKIKIASSEVGQPKSLEEEILGIQKKYVGEKIKLDFYETDIKNVFRILRSVGKLNFAIDKNVDGKVTLTLEDPVPWDQVLDLVLKMNNLGMKKEGNVIRIATLDTLKKEEKLHQDAIAAKKKSMEQKKSLQPLVTEYIPINYSDAEADVKPHVEQILTADRGKISVDKRTNMIIITDTEEKINQAREIIYRLDMVTPQIMIEAKVVEVTKDFTKELGLGLSLSQSRETLTDTGQNYSFDVALNHPTAAPVNSGSFNFWRILGSSYLSLNAQIAASESKGDVHVVSSPRILTLDNKKAKIKQGLEYAYLERDDTGGSSVKFKNIDLLLEVTPHVTPDKRIAMNVYLTKNDIDSITNGVPSLSTNEAETELLVNDNDTIVIGGIVKTTDNKGVSGTPILSDIPILGRLFRTETTKDKRNELLIFITPSIVQLDQKKNDRFVSQRSIN